jgi:ABC-2 type transport system ATP-binding protein
MAAVEVRDLEKSYKDVKALKGINFSARQGDILGFLGPNGAGKTTTIRKLSTILQPDGGDAYISGHSVVNEAKEVRKIIGLLPEVFGFYEEMTAMGYLAFNASFYHVDEQRCREMLELVGLDKVAEKRIRTFSHGMRQKLGLALALINDPEVLILDEPTNGLDPKAIFEFEEIVRGLKRQGNTVFLSSHILPEVQKLCDEVCIINEGMIVSTGSVDSISKKLTGLRARIVLAEPVLNLHVEGVEGLINCRIEGNVIDAEVKSYDALAEINERLVKSGARVFEIRPVEASLEEIFLKVTGGGK